MVHRQHGCSTFIFGLAFAAFGFVFLLIFGQRVDLTCSRGTSALITCEKHQSFLGLVPWREETFTGLRDAYVEENCDEGCTYRVVMMTETEDVPFTGAYSSGYRAKEELARDIVRFCDSNQRAFEISEGPGLIGTLIPGIFIAVGMAVAVGGVLAPILRRMRGY